MGHDNFNTDVWKWKARSYDFGSGVFTFDFQKTLQKYHPGVTLMWLGAFGIKSYNLYYDIAYKTPPTENIVKTVFELDFVQKLFVVTAIGAVLAFIFFPLKKLFGLKYAFLSIFLVSFEPFYIGLTRVFHLEGLLSALMLASVVWLYYHFKQPKTSKLILSGVFAGLSFLTKTTALFLLPFFALTTAIFFYKEAKSISKTFTYLLKSGSLWLISFVFTAFLLWPILWVNPVDAVDAMYRGVSVIGIEREHEQFYFSKFVTDPGPTFYVVVFALRSSFWLLIGLVGLALARKKALNSSKSEFVIFLLIYGIFYLIQLTIPSKKLDRYVMPSLVSFALIASFFYLWFLENVKLNKIVKILALTIPILYTCYYLHPDYFSYYNPIFGGLRTGIGVIEPKWIIGTPEIQNYFKRLQKSQKFEPAPEDKSLEALIKTKQINRILAVSFAEKYYTQIWPFFREFGAWAVIDDITPQAVYSQYFVYPVWEDPSSRETRFKLLYVDSIKLRGVPVYNVYKKI